MLSSHSLHDVLLKSLGRKYWTEWQIKAGKRGNIETIVGNSSLSFFQTATKEKKNPAISSKKSQFTARDVTIVVMNLLLTFSTKNLYFFSLQEKQTEMFL